MSEKYSTVEVQTFVSIDHREVSKEAQNYLKAFGPLYKDTFLGEDIYDMEDAMQDLDETLPAVKAEIEELYAMVEEKSPGCVYLRIHNLF